MGENEKFSFIIENEHAGLRIDSVLSLLMEDVSRSYIQKLIEGGNVSVDSSVCLSKKFKLSEGQSVDLLLPPPVPCEAVPEDIPLDIVYEDDDLIVINKPRGMVVHPAAGNLNGTLVNGLLFHCGSLSAINGVERPGIVHRIDKDTSGLLVAAKSDAAHRGLAAQFAEHSITRRYKAIACYGFREDEGTVDAPIGRDRKNRLRMAVEPDGKRAVTHYKVLERFNGFTLIEARLETGRTHQIRVHMAHIHHPLLGDTVYGPAKQPFGLKAQMLHAGVLGFVHPVSGEYLEFSCDPPADFQDVLLKLRK
ncbi:MAG: RluA family pseudouridine synthase [Firmicutes bacterium]|nr:RluA family pseudouridine synthase [Bacillota bacterium]